MRTAWLVFLGLGVAAIGVPSTAGVPERRHRIVLQQDLDVSAFESEAESSERVRIAFDDDGGLVVISDVHDGREDTALVWRRIGPDGELSPPTRIALPDLAQRIAHIQSIAVDSSGTTSIALRTKYRESWDVYGSFMATPTEILRVRRDGTLIGRLSLGVTAERALLAAHGDLVNIAYDADYGDDGDRAVYWRQIGGDGAFTGDAVRLSAPLLVSDPLMAIGIWDLFHGVDAGGVSRVLYQRIEYTKDTLEITDGPGVFWHAVRADSGATPAVSLGQVPEGVGSWKSAFAPDGSVCVCMYQWADTLGLGTSYPPPLIVSPQGEVREVDGRVLPKILTYYPGEQYGVGADAASDFHVGVFAIPGYLDRPGTDQRLSPSVYLGTVTSKGEAGTIQRIRIRRKPEYVWDYHVAADGTRMIGGSTYVSEYSPYRSKRREDVTILFADREGRPVRRATFRNPFMTNVREPLLASTSAGGRQRFAAAWSGWLTPERPNNRYVRVVLFEREVGP